MQTSPVGRLEVGDLVGRGGLADVHAARDPDTGARLAIKRLRRPDSGAAQRLAREAEVLRSLDHPGIPHLYDADVDDERPFLVVDLIEGASLAAILRDGDGTLDFEQTRDIGAQVADALHHAHQRGVVHRDVKPGNLLVDGRGKVHLIDFGVARDLDASAPLTSTGLVVGTVAYLSPEQVTGQEVTAAADVYSLGLLLLECVTGVRAYPGGTLEAALARMSRPPDIPADLPPWFASLIRAMTALDPADRPSAAEVARHLGEQTSPSVAAVDEPREDDTVMVAWNPPTTVMPAVDVAAASGVVAVNPPEGDAGTDRSAGSVAPVAPVAVTAPVPAVAPEVAADELPQELADERVNRLRSLQGWSPRALALGIAGILLLLGALIVGLGTDGRSTEPNAPVASTVAPPTIAPEPAPTTAPPDDGDEGDEGGGGGEGRGNGKGHGNGDDD